MKLVPLPPLTSIEPVAMHGKHGGVRYDSGSAPAGILGVGHEAVGTLHVTVPPGPLETLLPDIPKVAAFTTRAFPLVLKLPLSTIPHVGAFKVALPLMLTPSMLAEGAPSVYRQPLLIPPLRFVATARAVIACLLIPRTFMKYVGCTTETKASTYRALPGCFPEEGGLLISTQIVPTVAPGSLQLATVSPLLVNPFVAEASLAPAITPPAARFDAPAIAAASAAVCCKRF